MSDYVLRYRGSGDAPQTERDRVRSDPRVQVLDETPRMFLVDVSDADARALESELGAWVMSREQFMA